MQVGASVAELAVLHSRSQVTRGESVLTASPTSLPSHRNSQESLMPASSIAA